jgi:FlaA1/EpsC-like NDP-sugar epimerase
MMSFSQHIPYKDEWDPYQIKLDYADLLSREIVPLQSANSHTFLHEQIILVTGAAGSIGSELCRQLLNYSPARVIALDMNETGLFDLAESVRSHPHSQHLQLHIGNITDASYMEAFFAKKKPSIIFHAAAYKHVPLLELYPDQAIRTNVLATYNLCCLAQKYGIERFIFISTDKAADPISIMGASKRFGEMIILSLAQQASHQTCFCAVRFGNVIGSRGSVVPTFARQIENGGPVTVTDANATRYFMTIPEACDLTILLATLAETGNIYLLDMGRPVRIIDLAHKMIHLYQAKTNCAVNIVYTGLRPGERLHETLTALDESLKPTIHSKIFRVACENALPTFSTITRWVQLLDSYLLTEDDAMLRQHIFELVLQPDLVPDLVKVR